MIRVLSITAVLFAVVFSAPATLFGQVTQPYTAPTQTSLESPYKGLKLKYFAYQFNLTTGLNSNSIQRIEEDKDGRIWFTAFNAGFSVMDGEHLYHFGSHNGFFDRYGRLHCDLDGNIWLGGNGVGVTMLHSGHLNDRYVQIGQDISDVHIQDIKSDSKDNIWVSTRLGGITCIKKDTSLLYGIEALGMSEDLKQQKKYIHGMTIDGEDRVWAIANEQIVYIEKNEVYALPQDLLQGKVFKSLGGDGKRYVIGITNDYELYKITPDGAEKFTPNIPYHKKFTTKQVRYDKNGTLYLGNGREIFKIVDGEGQAMLNAPEGFGPINEFIFDHNNSMWIATDQQGIIYIPKYNLIRMSGVKASDHSSNFKTFFSDGYMLNAKIDDKDGLSWDTLFTFPKGEDLHGLDYVNGGAIYYLGEKLYGINNQYKPDQDLVKKFEKYKRVDVKRGLTLIRDQDNYFLFEDEEGVLHKTDLQSEGDVHFFHKEREKYYFMLGNRSNKSIIYVENDSVHHVYDNLGGDSIQFTAALYVDPETFLCTTWGLYYFKISPEGNTMYTRNVGSNILWGYEIDKFNNLWVGGMEGGVNFISSKTDSAVNIGPGNGLTGSRMMSLGVFPSGNAAVGTTLGLDYFILKDDTMLVRTEEDFFKKYEHRSYTFADGLMNQAFRAPFEDENGRLWFKDNNGTPHILFPNDTTQFSPEFLTFESILIEDRSKEHKILFNWTPGRTYDAPSSIEMNYDETLLLTIHSMFFQAHSKQNYTFRIDDGNWTVAHKSPTFRIAAMDPGEHRLEFKSIAPNGNESEVVSLQVTVDGPIYQSAWFWILVGGVFIGLVYLLFRWRTHVVRLRAKVLERTVEARTEEIQLAKIEIETQHNEIKDSIEYAKRIQEAILPAPRLIERLLPDSFVLYRPKDIVAGDFYWFEEVGDIVIFAAADCTGHGVPGAMVSVVCHNALERAVREFYLHRPSDILNKTRELVLETFEKSESEVKDGMDIGIIALNRKTLELEFAGANNPLYLINEGELTEVKGDKQPVGSFENPMPFTNHAMKIDKGTLIYSFTDGFADQFGGDKGKKFKYRPFKELLLRSWKMTMKEQQTVIQGIFDEWKGDLEQVDDVCIIGVRV